MKTDKIIHTLAYSSCGWFEVRNNARTNKWFIVELHCVNKKQMRKQITGGQSACDAWAEDNNTSFVWL